MGKMLDDFWSHVEKTESGCWLFTGSRLPTGYGRLRYNGKSQYAHRVSWEITNGKIPDGYCVCHKCDNPPCVNPSHLFIGTVLENMRDRDAKGRNGLKGKHRELGSGNTKYTIETVLAIRESKLSYSNAAQEFGVSRSTVWAIRRRVTWRNI